MLLVNSQSGRAAVQVPAPSLMLDDGEVERRVRLIRPMERHSHSAGDDAADPLAGSRPRDLRRAPGQAELAEVPEFTDSDDPYRRRPAAADLEAAAERVDARLSAPDRRRRAHHRPPGLAGLGRAVRWQTDAPTLSPDDAFAALIDGKTVLDLAEGLQLRRVRVMGANRIELTGFTDAMRDRLQRLWPVPRDHLLEAAPVRADRRDRRRRSSPRCWSAIRSRASPSGRRRDMPRDAAELAHRLAREAEAVCRHYLSNGRREGRYWLVGDVRNTPGRSLFVRLNGPESGKGAAGKWTDAATGEHGDLLDLIRESCGLGRLPRRRRRGATLPQPAASRAGTGPMPSRQPPAPTGSPEAARRLFAMSQPIAGTVVETYLRRRGITALHGTGSLRFHPRCYYRPDEHAPTETWPALIAAVTDLDGQHHRRASHLARSVGRDKAPIDTPRRAMGHLLGNARPLRSWRAT